MAFENLKANKGLGTPGVDGGTVEGFNIEDVRALIADLREERYRPRLLRRIQLAKPGGGYRTISIPTFRDKLVQEVARMILEAVYEGVYVDSSHGFRRGRRCHTALREVRIRFNGVKWMFKGDVRKCFDTIDHHTLIAVLEKRVKDHRMIRLVWKFIRQGYIEDFTESPMSLRGVPQGGVLSPLLANVFLNELDWFVERLREEFNLGTKRRVNNPWRRLHYAREVALRKKDYAKVKELDKQILRTPSGDPLDPKFRKLVYVRYADDVLVGVIGSWKDACSIQKRIKDFLHNELCLTLGDRKAGALRSSREFQYFLGTKLKVA